MKFSKTIAALGLGATLAFGGALVATSTQADQPHMQNALSDLQAAKGELQAALPDKGGHRVNAIRDTNAAITETQAGMAVGAGF